MIRFSFSITLELGHPDTGEHDVTFESWQRLRKMIKRRDGSICQYCGYPAPDGHVDHVIPLSRGGTDSIDNLKWACPDCNGRKANKPVEDFQQDLQPLTVEVIQHDEDGNSTGTHILSIESVDQSKLIEFAVRALGGASLAVHSMAGGGKLFSLGQYGELMSALENLGYVVNGKGNRPRELTPLGQSVFEQLVTETEKESTDD